MTSTFDWKSKPSELAKNFRPRNDKPGAMPPILFDNTPKWKAPEPMKKRSKK